MSQREQSGDLYRLKHKEGTHLGSSQDTPGAFRGILFDDENRLVGHAEWEKVDENEYGYDYSCDVPLNQQDAELSPEMEKLAQVVGEILVVATMYALTEYVAPSVKHWWQTKAVPTVKEKWQIFTDRARDRISSKGKQKDASHTSEIGIASEAFQGMLSEQIKDAYERYKNDMTSEEAQRELLDIFILSALLDKKIRNLSNARIMRNRDVPGEYLDGQTIIESITMPEYVDSVNQILENNPQLVKERTIYLSEVLEHNLLLDGRYVPADNEKSLKVR